MRIDTLSSMFLAAVAFISVPLASRKPQSHFICLTSRWRTVHLFYHPSLPPTLPPSQPSSHSLSCPSSYFAELNAGLVGLALTYTISLAGMFQYCVRQSAEVENTVRSSTHIVSFRCHCVGATSWE